MFPSIFGHSDSADANHESPLYAVSENGATLEVKHGAEPKYSQLNPQGDMIEDKEVT